MGSSLPIESTGCFSDGVRISSSLPIEFLVVSVMEYGWALVYQ